MDLLELHTRLPVAPLSVGFFLLVCYLLVLLDSMAFGFRAQDFLLMGLLDEFFSLVRFIYLLVSCLSLLSGLLFSILLYSPLGKRRTDGFLSSAWLQC